MAVPTIAGSTYNIASIIKASKTKSKAGLHLAWLWFNCWLDSMKLSNTCPLPLVFKLEYIRTNEPNNIILSTWSNLDLKFDSLKGWILLEGYPYIRMNLVVLLLLLTSELHVCLTGSCLVVIFHLPICPFFLLFACVCSTNVNPNRMGDTFGWLDSIKASQKQKNKQKPDFFVQWIMSFQFAKVSIMKVNSFVILSVYFSGVQMESVQSVWFLCAILVQFVWFGCGWWWLQWCSYWIIHLKLGPEYSWFLLAVVHFSMSNARKTRENTPNCQPTPRQND